MSVPESVFVFSFGWLAGALIALIAFAYVLCKLRKVVSQLRQELRQVRMQSESQAGLLDGRQESYVGNLPGSIEVTSPGDHDDVKRFISDAVEPLKQQVADVEKQMQSIREAGHVGDRWPGRIVTPQRPRTESNLSDDVGSEAGSVGADSPEIKKMQAVVGAAGVTFGKQIGEVKKKMHEMREELTSQLNELRRDVQAGASQTVEVS